MYYNSKLHCCVVNKIKQINKAIFQMNINKIIQTNQRPKITDYSHYKITVRTALSLTFIF